MSNIGLLKEIVEKLLIQIDDIIESFWDTEDSSVLDDIPQILLQISEHIPSTYQRSHEQILHYSNLFATNQIEELQNDLLFLTASLDESNSTENIEEKIEEEIHDAMHLFSENALLLLDDFLDEATEQLNTFESSLLEYRQNPILQHITVAFRAIHTLKGGFRFIESYKEEHLCHICEDILAQWRDGIVVVNTQKISLLLKVVEILREGIDHIMVFRLPIQKNYDDIIENIVGNQVEEIEATISIFRPLKNGPTKIIEIPLSDGISEIRGYMNDNIPIDLSIWELIEEIAEDFFLPNIAILSHAIVEILHIKKRTQELDISLRCLQNSILHMLDNVDNIGQEIEIQNLMIPENDSVESVEYIRIPTDQLDGIFQNLVELEIIQGRLLSQVAEYEQFTLNTHIKQLSKNVELLRQQKLEVLFQRIPKIVSDIGKQLNKDVQVVMEGEHLRLNRNIIESLQGPFLHLIRNAIDHGIESPLERLHKGKPAKATLHVKASQAEQYICISISDDGKGIEADIIFQKAIEKNIIQKHDILSHRQVLELIFQPGFSTKEVQNKFSGRGVGLDVVHSTITDLQGSIEISTEIDKGTCFELMIPARHVALPHLLLQNNGVSYFIHTSSIREIVHIKENLPKYGFFHYRKQNIPFISLHEVLFDDGLKRHEPYACIIHVNEYLFALGVQEVFDIEDIVIQRVPPFFDAYKMFAGATIDKNRRPILIIDIHFIIKEFDIIQYSLPQDQSERSHTELYISICRDAQWYSLPLSSLQHLSSDALQISNAQPFVNIEKNNRNHYLYFHLHQKFHFIDIDQMGDITEGQHHPHLEILHDTEVS